MEMNANFSLMADYNRWMNQRIYQSAESIDVDELWRDRGAFFGSIMGTLNHILVGDTLWLGRFSNHSSDFTSLKALNEHPLFASLDQILYEDLPALKGARESMDDIIIAFIKEARESDYDKTLVYKDTKGTAMSKNFGQLVQHFFNHQTHHRGQVTTLFSQLGHDVGVTDLLALIPASE